MMSRKSLSTSNLLRLIRKNLWLSLLLLPGTSTTSFASVTDIINQSAIGLSETENAQLKKQRLLYQQAEDAFKKGQFSTFNKLSTKLKDYPLHPYLEYKAFSRNLSSVASDTADHFLSVNDDTVIGELFRLDLINHAAKNQKWQTVIDTYRPGFSTSTECKYLNALIHTQQAELAYPRVKALWLSASFQPKSCDAAFTAWEKSGHKTPQLIWQRFKLAMSLRNLKLARYLIKSMPQDDMRVAKLWLKLHRSPELVSSTPFLNLQHADQAEILLYGLSRLSYRDIDNAVITYNTVKSPYLNEQQDAEITRLIGLRLAKKHLPEASDWLARIPPSHINEQVREWKIRTAIRQGDWSLVLDGISLLPNEEQADHRWQYWYAYANEQLGNINDSLGIYEYLASKRSYYGFLAADHLNREYEFENNPLEPGVEMMNSIRQQPEAIRARELFFMGKELPARREWLRLVNRINTEQKLAASKLAQSWDWHDRAIITMGATRYRDDIVLRFPFEHEDNVHSWSEKHNINPAWTYAIIRRESAFMNDARSSVGALGLMQLMPSTARQIARQMKVKYKGRNSLLTSNTNIRLGTGYLERMLNKLESQQVLATAAYNAGPGQVSKWLPENQQMDAIRWIETIPFTETREYVSNVLAYMVIYEHLMDGKTTRLSSHMPPIPAKNPISISQNTTKEGIQTDRKVTNDPS